MFNEAVHICLFSRKLDMDDVILYSILIGRVEVIQRLAHITPIELGGKAHQSQDADNKLDQWLMYAMFACSCPPDSRESGGLTATKDLYHLIFLSLKSGSETNIVSTCYYQFF